MSCTSVLIGRLSLLSPPCSPNSLHRLQPLPFRVDLLRDEHDPLQHTCLLSRGQPAAKAGQELVRVPAQHSLLVRLLGLCRCVPQRPPLTALKCHCRGDDACEQAAGLAGCLVVADRLAACFAFQAWKLPVGSGGQGMQASVRSLSTLSASASRCHLHHCCLRQLEICCSGVWSLSNPPLLVQLPLRLYLVASFLWPAQQAASCAF